MRRNLCADGAMGGLNEVARAGSLAAGAATLELFLAGVGGAARVHHFGVQRLLTFYRHQDGGG